MKKTVIFLAAALALTTLSAGYTIAQTKVRIIKGEDKVIFKKNTKIDFDGGAIEGEIVKPEGSYTVERSRARFESLIKPRMNFNPEMFKNARKL